MRQDDRSGGEGRRGPSRNVFGEPLLACSMNPVTGFYRDGCCNTGLEAVRLVSGMRFNSPGGNLLEGVKLASIIRYAKIATIVPNGAKCASACFVAFAAGNQKF